MSLDIGAAVRDGAKRTATVNGGLLIAAFVVMGILTLVANQSLNTGIQAMTPEPPQGGVSQPEYPLALPIPLPVAAALLLVNAVLAEAIRITAVRTMATDIDGTIPAELIQRNLPLAVLNGFVGGIVVAVLVFLGTIFLIVPGIFLALSFFFVRQEIALEDENFIEAMVNSWELSSGNRLPLFGLALVVFAISLVVLSPWLALFVLEIGGAAGNPMMAGGSLTTSLLQVVLSAPVTVFGIGVATRAYLQLKGDDNETPDTEERTDTDDPWNDPAGVDV